MYGLEQIGDEYHWKEGLLIIDPTSRLWKVESLYLSGWFPPYCESKKCKTLILRAMWLASKPEQMKEEAKQMRFNL